VKRRMVLLLATVLSVFGLTVGHVGTVEAGSATDIVKSKQTALFEVIKQPQPSSAANQKKIQGLFDEMLDYSGLAQASLGTEWAARTPEEQAEFSGILKDLVRKAYEKNLKKTINFSIDYLGEEPSGGAVTVKTKATSKTNAREEPIEIHFKMVEKNGQWRVNDIVTEGVSLVSSYRTQFTKIVKKDGFPKLIEKMKKKLASGDV
jgi:phospholipid transport system substrate-binding protein